MGRGAHLGVDEVEDAEDEHDVAQCGEGEGGGAQHLEEARRDLRWAGHGVRSSLHLLTYFSLTRFTHSPTPYPTTFVLRYRLTYLLS